MPHGRPHYNGNGNGMRTMRGRATTRRAATPRTGRRVTAPRRAATPRTGRMMSGTGARGVRRTAGQFGRGGVRRATTRRPGPVMRRGRTQPMTMNRTQARGRMTSGQGNHGFRGVDGLGHNI